MRGKDKGEDVDEVAWLTTYKQWTHIVDSHCQQKQ